MTNMIFEEVAEHIVAKLPAEDVLSFQPSEAAKARVEYLMDANSRGDISFEERSELSRYLQIEELLGLMKARAHAKIATSSGSLAAT